MNIKPIKTEADYQFALVRVSELMDAEMNTPEGDELDILATLIESYETKHYPIAPPYPIEDLTEECLKPEALNKNEPVKCNDRMNFF